MNEVLSLRQKSMWNGFVFEFVAGSGLVVGGLQFPNFAQAKNARLAFHPRNSSAGDSKIQLYGEDYLLRFEYTRRGFINDIRYTLETPESTVVCTADVIFEANKRLPGLRLTAPTRADVLPSTAFWKKSFPIVSASGNEIGKIYSPKAITTRFEWHIHLPSASPPLQAFLLVVSFLVRR